jgi:DNA-directed RNA polymerase specialized sigma24 family protein
VPNEHSLQRLLAWLDGGVDSGGAGYVEMRRRLELYFERRNCSAPDHLADETLNRVARRLEEEGSIASSTPARFCYISAKFVLLEYLRRKKEVPLRDVEVTQVPEEDDEMMSRLEDCLETLTAAEREIIVEYYRGETREKIEHRRDLAQRLGLTMNALTIRACRIREKLELCVRKSR